MRSKIKNSVFWVSVSRSRLGLRFGEFVSRLSGFGCRVSRPGYRFIGFLVSCFGFRAAGFGSRVSGFGFQVPGLELRVKGVGLRREREGRPAESTPEAC